MGVTIRDQSVMVAVIGTFVATVFPSLAVTLNVSVRVIGTACALAVNVVASHDLGTTARDVSA